MSRRIVFGMGHMLIARIKARLAENARIGAMRIEVKISKGIAELSGMVANVADRELVGKIALGVRDVEYVRNNILVRDKGS